MGQKVLDNVELTLSSKQDYNLTFTNQAVRQLKRFNKLSKSNKSTSIA